MEPQNPLVHENLTDRFRGTLLGVAVGDALGAVRRQARPSPVQGSPEQDALLPLRCTDDTHMTLATATSLIACGGFDADHMGATLAEQYAQEPWQESTSEEAARVLDGLRAGRRLEEMAAELFGGTGSFGNGAAMRVAPIGLLDHRDMATAASVARSAAKITHAHPIGQDGAALQAAAVAELVRMDRSGGLDRTAFVTRLQEHAATRRFQDLLEEAKKLFEASPSQIVDLLGNGVEAHRSVTTSLLAFLRAPDRFEDAVLFAVSLGGDADTITSMTGALAGAWLGRQSIPGTWVNRLDEAEEIVTKADALRSLFLARSDAG